MNINAAFWNNRYKEGRTGWDMGHVSTPLQTYFDQLENKAAKILIPGCGNAHEAEYLFKKGFEQVYVADLSKYPLRNFKNRVPDFPQNQLLHIDFFDIRDQFDLIIEQTFLCALSPNLRLKYTQQMNSLLKPNGKLVGLLFNQKFGKEGNPPYGGNLEEYQALFAPYFKIDILEPSYNSVKPRMGSEFFIHLTKK